MEQQRITAQQFGRSAYSYLTSAVHATGSDLQRLAALAGQGAWRHTLDLGCGAGHVSFLLAAHAVQRVVAYDLAAPMLALVAAEAAARGHVQIETCQGAAERLPFPNASFDRVVTRFSAHHWSAVPAALAEVRRVLRPGGRVVVIDVVAPESPVADTLLQTVELLRDASHVRDYRVSEWQDMLGAVGLTIATRHDWKLRMEFASWVARMATPPARVEAIKAVFDGSSDEVRDYFAIEPDYSFSIDAAWLEMTR